MLPWKNFLNKSHLRNGFLSCYVWTPVGFQRSVDPTTLYANLCDNGNLYIFPPERVKFPKEHTTQKISIAIFWKSFKVFFFNYSINLIYFWLHWVFVAVHGLSLVVANRDYSLLRCTGFSCCSGFSCCGARALGARASVAAARRLSSCGTRA